MSETPHIFVRLPDGTEADITEGVQALYDLVLGSVDWGSGFWTAEDAAPVAKLGRLCGFEQVEEAERYLREQQHSEEQMQFIREHREAVDKYKERTMQAGGYPVPHDHVFSSTGRCMWPWCPATEETVTSVP